MSDTTSPDPVPAVEQPNPTVDELEADRAATRERLATNIEALAAKADVKGQAKAKASETADQVKARASETADQVKAGAHDAVEQVKQLPPAALAGIAVATVVVLVLIIRSSRRG